MFFAGDYPQEFNAIFGRRTITAEPTVYVCAQDRGAGTTPAPGAAERLLVLINAPADGDLAPADAAATASLAERVAVVLGACGLRLSGRLEDGVATTPSDFDGLFPASGGALYGRANHGTFASFRRSGARSRIPGLYLAGGSVHPGPGVPMAALSGRLAAASLAEDFRA